MLFISFIPRSLQTGSSWPQSMHSLYWAFSKPIFVLGTILTTLPTILGIPGSFFNLILTCRALSFIARVSFCTYLVHLMVIMQFILTRSYDIYFYTSDLFVINLGMLVLSLIFGTVLTVIVELPFANLQKHLVNSILGNKRSRQLDKI